DVDHLAVGAQRDPFRLVADLDVPGDFTRLHIDAGGFAGLLVGDEKHLAVARNVEVLGVLPALHHAHQLPLRGIENADPVCGAIGRPSALGAAEACTEAAYGRAAIDSPSSLAREASRNDFLPQDIAATAPSARDASRRDPARCRREMHRPAISALYHYFV